MEDYIASFRFQPDACIWKPCSLDEIVGAARALLER
jgi:hypothetical protein